jgi:hypothetical protein
VQVELPATLAPKVPFDVKATFTVTPEFPDDGYIVGAIDLETLGLFQGLAHLNAKAMLEMDSLAPEFRITNHSQRSLAVPVATAVKSGQGRGWTVGDWTETVGPGETVVRTRDIIVPADCIANDDLTSDQPCKDDPLTIVR